eukprot:TRINITY_DN26926_c0_g1_i1.p1 TRINITY_DN26926_c0_g1~~TRINITY_DN26926_c0_g1_i1.p1  ORF type:complete len:266 (+),score=33.24 TRINITY_DN26926_c0_g1_i1:204-1001(+)
MASSCEWQLVLLKVLFVVLFSTTQAYISLNLNSTVVHDELKVITLLSDSVTTTNLVASDATFEITSTTNSSVDNLTALNADIGQLGSASVALTDSLMIGDKVQTLTKTFYIENTRQDEAPAFDIVCQDKVGRLSATIWLNGGYNSGNGLGNLRAEYYSTSFASNGDPLYSELQYTAEMGYAKNIYRLAPAIQTFVVPPEGGRLQSYRFPIVFASQTTGGVLVKIELLGMRLIDCELSAQYEYGTANFAALTVPALGATDKIALPL